MKRKVVGNNWEIVFVMKRERVVDFCLWPVETTATTKLRASYSESSKGSSEW